MTEILAPAGSHDSLLAAVRCGADAVYLGADTFNARGNAQNFTREGLENAVKYCHERDVKVYLTLNTVISDDEMTEVEDLISFCGKIGIDAFIVQDLSLVERIKLLAPAAHLHASTQMTVQTVEGIRFLESLGFTRVVVPRELTRDEIGFLCKNVKAELEVFVHGALCMCVSGQCYMSAMLGSRSGNRGLCAQPCRLPFSANNSGSCDLSLKDNSLVPYLTELEKMGVTSFKIEGRMKRPEYVAAAVTSCRNALAHKKDEVIENALRAVFSRSGFTDGYYADKRGSEMFGTREKEDVTKAKDVLGTLSKLYEKENPKFKVDFSFEMREGEKISLSAKSGEIKVNVKSDCIAEKAIKKEITKENVTEQLSKLGGTQFYTGEIFCDIEQGLSVPISQINKLRRLATEKLISEILIKNKPNVSKKSFKKDEIISNKNQHREISKTYLIFSRENQIPDNFPDNFSLVLPLSFSEKTFKKLLEKNTEVCCEMPRGIFTHSDMIKRKAEKLFELGVRRFFCPTIDSASIAKEIGADITASFGSNIFNSFSLNVWQKYFADEAMLSPEMTANEINKIKASCKTGVLLYGRLPLMLTRNCPIKNKLSCEQCRKNGKLTDRKGIEFPVDCTSGTSEVLNSVPIYMSDELKSFENIDFAVLKFTVENKEECREVIEKYLSREKYDKKFTRGLYRRGVI